MIIFEMERFVDAVLRKHDLEKFVLALKLIEGQHIHRKNQMTLFSTINFKSLMTMIQAHTPSILVLSIYDKNMFEYLLDHWTQFDGTEAIALIQQKKYEYIDRVPLNIVVDGKTPLDRFPDLKLYTNKYVLKAKTISMLGNGDMEKEVDALIERSKYNFKTLYILSQDVDIDIEAKYRDIRNASFLKSLLFVKNYYYIPFRERANKDTFIMQSFMSALRESLSWTSLDLYKKNKEKYKIYHLAKILQCMNKKVDSYRKQLIMLELEFL